MNDDTVGMPLFGRLPRRRAPTIQFANRYVGAPYQPTTTFSPAMQDATMAEADAKRGYTPNLGAFGVIGSGTMNDAPPQAPAPKPPTLSDLAAGPTLASLRPALNAPPPQPPPSQAFDLNAELGKLGAPPQRQAMPQRSQRQGFDVGALASGVADALAAYNRQPGGHSDRLLAMRERADERDYQDRLAQAALAYDNDARGFQHKMLELQLRQQGSAADRANRLQEQAIATEQSRYDAGAPMRDAQLAALQQETDITGRLAAQQLGGGSPEAVGALEQLYTQQLSQNPTERVEQIDAMIRKLAANVDLANPRAMQSVMRERELLEKLKAEAQAALDARPGWWGRNAHRLLGYTSIVGAPFAAAADLGLDPLFGAWPNAPWRAAQQEGVLPKR